MNSDRSPNDSQNSVTPITTGRQSVVSHESVLLPSNNNSSTQSLSRNHSSISTSRIITSQSIENKVDQNLVEKVNTSPSVKREHILINSQQRSSVPIKNRRYKITVMHSDEPLQISSNESTTKTQNTKVINSSLFYLKPVLFI
jgi:hypothetical protein